MRSRFTSAANTIWVPVVALVAISLVPRLWLLLNTQSFSSDGVSYLSTAFYIYDPAIIGEVPKRIYFILYPSLILLFDTFIRDIAMSGRLINLLVGCAIPPIVFVIGRRNFGTLTSFIAGIFCAINPVLVWQSSEIRGDNLFALLTLIAILLFERIDWFNPKARDSILFALVLGLAQLTRTNGVMYLFVIIPIWLFWIFKRRVSFSSWLGRTFVPFALVFMFLFFIPHMFLASRGVDRPSMFIYTYLDGNIAALGERESGFFNLNVDATEYQFLEDVADANWDTIIETLPSLPRKYGRNFVYAINLFLDPVIEIALKMSIILIPLIFYFFYYLGEIRIPSSSGRLLAWSLPSFILLPAINIEDLYFLPLIPVLLLFLAWILRTASSLGWISRWKNWILLALCLLVASSMIYETTVEIKKEITYENPYLRSGEWIKQNTDESALIMARNPEIFFHAFRRGYRMPLDNLNRTLSFMRHKKIDYIVFGPSEMKKREELFWQAYDEVSRMGAKSRLQVAHIEETKTEAVYILKVVPENFKSDFNSM